MNELSVARLTSLEQFERCLAESAGRPVLLLKHSSTWPISAGARYEFLSFAAGAPDAQCVEVLVREDRPLSLAVAERTGVRHESPQVICLVAGRALEHASHHDITGERLKRMLSAARR